MGVNGYHHERRGLLSIFWLRALHPDLIFRFGSLKAGGEPGTEGAWLALPCMLFLSPPHGPGDVERGTRESVGLHHSRSLKRIWIEALIPFHGRFR